MRFRTPTGTPLAFTPARDQVLSGRLINLAAAGPPALSPPESIARSRSGREAPTCVARRRRLWNAQRYTSRRGSEDRPKRRQIATGLVDPIAYSDDGSLAAAGFRGESNIKVYRTSDRKRTLLSQKDESARLSITTKIVFSDDGSLLAAVAESQRDQSFRKFVTLRMFDVATGNERVRVPLSQPPLGVRFTTDNQTVQVLGGQPHLEQLTSR